MRPSVHYNGHGNVSLLFSANRAQTTIELEQLTNRNVHVKICNCSVNVKTKDCAQSRPFQHKLQHHCFHGKVL